jgi:two-component system, sensor histidine kinase
MHGIEVARKLGRDLKTADVRLIALTGWGQAEDREKSRAAGWNRLDGRSVPDCP